MTYVYILSDYDEHGAEHVTATLDRSALLGMIDVNWPDAEEGWRSQAKAKLVELLENPYAKLAGEMGHDLHSDWGGIQLHVVDATR